MLKKSAVAKLCLDLKRNLALARRPLERLSVGITNDYKLWSSQDASYTLKYLEKYLDNNSRFWRQKRRPKGSILIILSYNEPFILSVIPVLNALVAGNEVTVRPSTRNLNFLEIIWGKDLVHDNQLPLTISHTTRDELTESVNQYRAVFFFGSDHVARTLAIACAQQQVEFYPEVESGDFSVVDYVKIDQTQARSLARQLLDDSFYHFGQSCQRLQGCYVREDSLSFLTRVLLDEFAALPTRQPYVQGFSTKQRTFLKKGSTDVSKLLSDSGGQIHQLQPAHLPAVIFSPRANSNLVQQPLFWPVFWVVPYSNEIELTRLIQHRPYSLGANIRSDRPPFVRRLIGGIRQTRITINRPHVQVEISEGWGGSYPTGTTGYQSWLETFTYPYTVLMG